MPDRELPGLVQTLLTTVRATGQAVELTWMRGQDRVPGRKAEPGGVLGEQVQRVRVQDQGTAASWINSFSRRPVSS